VVEIVPAPSAATPTKTSAIQRARRVTVLPLMDCSIDGDWLSPKGWAPSTRRKWDSGRVKGKLLVAGQFLLIGLLVVLPSFDHSSSPHALRIVGYLMLGAGMVLVLVSAFRLDDALTPWPEPRAAATLRTDGVYGRVRHPIYTGVLLIGFGLALRGLSVWSVATALALCGLLFVKSRYEERMLSERFSGYAAYAKQVPRFVPRLRAK